MKFLLLLGVLLGSFFKTLFGKSEGERLGASEAKADMLEKQIEVRDAMDRAEKISTRDQLLDVLDKGKLAFLFCFLGLAACTTTAIPTITCPNVVEWTGAQQAQMAADVRKLPQTSPVAPAMADYFNMRQEARACKKALGGR